MTPAGETTVQVPGPQEFEGLSAIVTGGASGIGLATVNSLLAQGCRVAVLDLDVSSVNGREDLLAYQCDVSDANSVSRAVASAVDDLAGLDIVVNNAGIGAQGTVEENSDDEWRIVFEVNVFGMVRVVRAALATLRESQHGSIVNTCSVAAEIGLPRRALYSASKGAVLALTRSMAGDHLAEGIRVNCVNPGTADTPWVQRLLSQASDPLKELEALSARQPHRRLVSADEVAGAICYLASPRSGSTTGVALDVDGGLVRLRVPSS
jgi:NAD(P)-dependent dehydrogenase (short-subunit alcohol dehydrogenase family)